MRAAALLGNPASMVAVVVRRSFPAIFSITGRSSRLSARWSGCGRHDAPSRRRPCVVKSRRLPRAQGRATVSHCTGPAAGRRSYPQRCRGGSVRPDQSVAMECEVRHLLRINYRPASAAIDDNQPEPMHLQVFNDVYGRTLRRGLNAQLAGAAATNEPCAHCQPSGRLQIRTATISGSVADRIGWLFLGGYRFPLRSDSDFLLELDISGAPLRAEHDSAKGDPCVAASDVSGYYRLLRGRRPRCRHPGRRELAAGAVRAALREAVRRHRPEQPPPTVSGPAVSFSDPSGVGGEVDCVPCVSVHEETVLPWLTELRARRRPSGWPDDRLLTRLAGPLLLVPVGPRADDTRLWRLSFSRPEAALVRSLPSSARYCLMLLKAVRAGRRERLASVSSYYLKTCVLWLCQERPEPHWQDTLTAMGAVLDMLQRAVRDEFLPCFFCSEINVLREPTEQRLASISGELRYFQQNLLSLLHAMLTTLRPAEAIQF